MQDEIRMNTMDESSSKTDDEDNCALGLRRGRGKVKFLVPNQILIMEVRRRT